MMWWYLGHGWGWYGIAGMFLSVVLVLCVVGALIYALLRAGDGRSADPRTTADRLLMERYARGEIDEQEFETRRRVLRQTRQ